MLTYQIYCVKHQENFIIANIQKFTVNQNKNIVDASEISHQSIVPRYLCPYFSFQIIFRSQFIRQFILQIFNQIIIIQNFQIFFFGMQEKPKSSSAFCLITAVVALLVSTILNIFYRQELYDHGMNFIYDYQTNNSNAAITVIQNIISILGNTIFIIAFLAVVHIITYRKMYTIVYLIYITINAYLIAVEKQAYHDPRPFHSNQLIQSLEWSCPRSFGFPSGHSWIAILLYEPFLSDIIGTKTNRYLLWITIISTGVLIPLSRLYLGSHSTDQITSGLLHSISFLILYKFFFQQKIYHLLHKCIQKGSLILIASINTLLFGVSIAIPFIIYAINMNNRVFQSSLLDKINVVCKKNIGQDDLEKQAGTAAAIIGLVFGLVYGLLLDNVRSIKQIFFVYQQSGTYDGLILYLKGSWNFSDKWTNGLKFLLLYILFGGVFIGVLSFGVSSTIKSFYGQYLIQTLGYCLFGMSITFFIPYLLMKFKIIDVQIKQMNLSDEHFAGKSYRQI